MSGRPVRAVLVGLAVAAVAVEAVHVAGAGRWHRLAALAAGDPTRAAALAAAPVGTGWLPSTVALTRRLPGEALEGAGPAAAADAWERLGVRQRRWLPTDPEGYESAARAAALRGEAAAALEWNAEAIRRDPTDPYQRLAAVALELGGGGYDAALEQLAEAEALEPGAARAVQVLPGDDVWVRLEGLRRRLERYPRTGVRTRLALAAALRGLGREEEAAAALAPVADDPEAVLQRAAWALEDGEPVVAAAAVEPLVRASWQPASLRARAMSLTAQSLEARGRTDEAAALARRALELAPGSPAPYVALAGVATRRGDREAAAEHLRRAWGMAPGDLGVILAFARAARAAGRDDDAQLALERAVAVAPDRPDVRAQLVEHLLARDQGLEASLRLAEALERFPSDRRLLALVERARRGAPPR